MKRITRTLIVLVLAIALMTSCISGANSSDSGNMQPKTSIGAAKLNRVEKSKDINQYSIVADLNTEDKLLTAEQNVKYINNEDIELKELYFHVYTNAFKTEVTAPFLFDDFKNAYPRGFQPGYTEIKSVSDTARGSQLEYSFQGEGSTIMKVKLASPIKPGEAVELNMQYVVHIPPAGERFGWGETNFNMGNWYPIAAVYDKKDGWNLDKYYPIGDPFFSDTADYDVVIKAPREYIVAASGHLIDEKVEGNIKTWKFEANGMRDFAFIANSNFVIAERIVDGTIVKSYYYKEHSRRGKEALRIGAESLKLFNEKFGKYPFPSFSVVETEFPSGMEYPGLIYISDKSYEIESSMNWFTIVIVHETGHQWWYSLVGNDEIDEAWLDEGITSYSEKIYEEMKLGKKDSDRNFRNHEQRVKKEAEDIVVAKPLSEFESWDDYGPTVYTKGAVIMNEIRKLVGEEKFFRILQTYFDEYKFKIAYTEDFINVCEKVSGMEMDDFFDSWLYEKE
ncbi:MAG: M1 family metallopeptidase [Bacillota bacterium]